MGLLKGLGSFGERVWSAVRGVAQPIREALGIAREAGLEPTPSELRGEYHAIEREIGLASTVAEVPESDFIPRNLYGEADIPWKMPFAYKVEITGVNLDTGEYETTHRWITYSAEQPVGDVLNEAYDRFDETGAYPQVSIDTMNVVAAQFRAGQF